MPPIAYTEEHGSPVESKEDGVFEATRILRCAWADRLTLMAELTNESYPYDTSQAASALGFGVEPAPGRSSVGSGDKIIAYDDALVRVTYRSPSSDSGELVDTYITTERLEPTITMIQLPYERFRWGASGDELLPDEAPTRQAHGMDYIVSHLNISPVGPPTYDTFGAIVPLAGKVNDNAVVMRILPYTIGAGKLLCLNPLVTRNGAGLFDFTYAFSIFQEGWNKFWRSSTLAWEEIYINGSPPVLYKNYPEGDFSPLFIT